MSEILLALRDQIQWVFSGIGTLLTRSVLPGRSRTKNDETVGTVILQENCLSTPEPLFERNEVTRVVHVGDYLEIDIGYSIRVTLLAVCRRAMPHRFSESQEKAEDVARIRMDRTGVFFAGEEVIREDVNEFVVPIVTRHEASRSVCRYETTGSYFRFVSICVEHINISAQKAELRIFTAEETRI